MEMKLTAYVMDVGKHIIIESSHNNVTTSNICTSNSFALGP